MLPVSPLAALLLLASPLDCPPGTALSGGGPPELFEAWCTGRPDAYGTPRRHGPARSWYDTGALRVEAHWAEGRRDGAFIEHHRDGKPARTGQYARDEKVGTWTIWFESGQLEERSEYVRDVQHGPFTAWFRTGGKRTEGRYCHGVQCGAWTTWDEEGRLVGRMEFGEQRATP
ncbi:MAG: hypothetical protein IPO09_18375 [Anaeromyxobacter sp.]|nr:hypothetical protein [Anaeromyxobacter sp.]MBL0276978.1 hypothetical protein [Anaeromyxobacter sp.]